MSAALRYRLYQPDDLPGVLRLWEAESGWGAISAEQWHKWYVDTPLGPCLVVVAEDEHGEIAAQKVFTPARLVIDGQEHRALRISAPIVRQDARRRSMRSRSHPIVGLFLAALEAATEAGYSVMYSLPEHSWLSFFRWAPRIGLPTFATAAYGCVAAEIAPVAADGAGLSAEVATAFGPEYDALWQAAQRSFPMVCGVARDAAWMNFKNRGHLVLAARAATGELVGYVAIRKQTGLIVDLLARHPDDLRSVVAAALAWLADARQADMLGGMTQLKAMATPLLSPALSVLDFTPVEYTFAFVCAPLTPALSPATIAPERWSVNPGD